MGSRTENVQSLKAVRRKADVFIGRVDKSVEISDIEKYIKEVFDISVIKTEILKIKSEQFNAFKITMLFDERDTLFNSKLWPEGMVVNKYYNRRV